MHDFIGAVAVSTPRACRIATTEGNAALSQPMPLTRSQSLRSKICGLPLWIWPRWRTMPLPASVQAIRILACRAGIVNKRLTHVGEAQCPNSLLRIRLCQLLLPKITRHSMVLQYFILLLGVVQLDPPRSLVHPIDKKLSRLLAHPPLVADLDVIWPGAREAVCLGIVCHRPY